VGLHPELADWIADLSSRFGRPVAMSGSGPGLFAYFADLDEATSALAATPASARAAMAAIPRSRGVAPSED
jgi:4-diphosphocytidyl-2C-methyl-D-erythritol kinase